MKIYKLIPILFILLSFQTVLALGVTRPVPHDVELMRGESADFTFQIQAVTSTEKISCVYFLSDMRPLEVKFDSDEVIIDAGSKKDVYGTVTVPENTPFDTYSGTLSVSCGAVSQGDSSGSQVRTTIGGSPFSVNVVEVREKGIKEIRPEEKGISTEIIILIIITVILIIGAYYWLNKPKKKIPKKKSNKPKNKKPRKKRK